MTHLSLKEIQAMQPDPQRRRQSDDGGMRIHWPIIAWVLGLIVSAFASYNLTSASYDKRISVLEEKVGTMSQDVRDIKADVRTLLTR